MNNPPIPALIHPVEKNTPKVIYNHIVKICEARYGRDVKVLIVKRENSKEQIEYDKAVEKKKTLWILIETNEIRTEVREFIAKELEITEFYRSSSSSISQIKIIPEGDFVSQIRIMFKPFARLLRDYKWQNAQLIQILGSQLNNPDNPDEAEVLKKINEEISKYDSVILEIGGKKYKNVIGLNAGPHGKKSDFIVINSKGKKMCFISYKAGSSSKDFQQYGGISKREQSVHEHKETKEFISELTPESTLKSKMGTEKKALYRKIKNRKLKGMGVFGSDYKKLRGVNNVDFIAQGTPKMSYNEEKNILTLNFSTKLINNRRIDDLNGDYEPVLAVRTAESSRRFEGISGYRGGIFPKGQMEERGKEI